MDNAATMDMVSSIVSARLINNSHVSGEIKKISDSLNRKEPWSFYCSAWLLSKYGTADDVMRLIEVTVPLWVTGEHLSRMAAGVFPRLIGTPDQTKFEAILRRSGNQWSASVLDFHHSLSRDSKGYEAIKNFALAPNTSYPNRISHTKFFILLSLLNNPHIAPSAVTKLKNTPSWGLSDPFYAGLVS